MSSTWQRWRKEFARKMTFMVVPHGTARPRQVTFSLTFVLFLFCFWTGFTAWAAYMASQKFDYWRVKAKTHLLKLKVDYFAKEVQKARETLDEVKDMDAQLRTLMGMGTRRAIIERDISPFFDSTGGPTTRDVSELETALEMGISNMSLQEVSRQIQVLRKEMDLRLTSFKQITNKIEYERQLFRSTPLIWPANGYLTSHFGRRLSPFSGLADWHKGVDIAAPAGTPVRAAADGVVQLAGWAGGYGKIAVINHRHGYSTRYGHNRQILVKKGDKVKRGQIIALMGSTGNATGPHCHYEVWYLGRAVNPRRFMRQRS